MENNQHPEQLKSKKSFSGLQVLGIIAGTIVFTVVIILCFGWFYLFPRPFQPVHLTPAEQKQFEEKLDRIETAGMISEGRNENGRTSADVKEDFDEKGRLKPEKYTEEGANRDVLFTEREVNALIATNTDLAEKVAIDLSDNLVSAKMRVPVDPDFPFFGGKILRVRAGVEMAFREGRPVVILKGISIMGVPFPNAWIGGIKNVDLVKESGSENGFWKTFADGVDSIVVEEGRLKITMKE